MIIPELVRLKELRKAGILTEEEICRKCDEYNEKRKKNNQKGEITQFCNELYGT